MYSINKALLPFMTRDLSQTHTSEPVTCWIEYRAQGLERVEKREDDEDKKGSQTLR